jgi:putative membrane protein
MSDISKLVRTSLSDRLDGSTKARFDLHLDELTNALIVCDRLKKMPVPLIYTRHTGRFLGLWVLLLPLALASDMGGSFVVVPVCSVVSMLFFGIEELGVQIEEPFSILPLEDYVASIESAASQMLANEVEFENSEGVSVFASLQSWHHYKYPHLYYYY